MCYNRHRQKKNCQQKMEEQALKIKAKKENEILRCYKG